MNGFKDDAPVTLGACARFATGRMTALVERAVIVPDHDTTSSNAM